MLSFRYLLCTQYPQMAFNSITATKDQDIGDSFIDVAESEKRLVRVTTNTYKNTGGTFINIKLFKKKDEQCEFRLQQRVGLTAKEFQDMVANVENINMGGTTLHTATNEVPVSKRGVLSTKKSPESNKTKLAANED